MSRRSARCARSPRCGSWACRSPRTGSARALRYKTDHDEAGRATSCGPRTSRLMVQGARRGGGAARRSRAQPHDRRQHSRRARGRRVAPLASSRSRRGRVRRTIRSGFVVFLCDALVLAAGGPGRTLSRQRLSQALLRLARPGARSRRRGGQPHREPVRHRHAPRRLSLEPVRAPTRRRCPTSSRATREGRERNFLADYYRTTQELASNVFRKGYQWPFHATRMLDFGSSLVDLAIFRETPGGAHGADGLQPQSRARAGRRAVLARPARRGRARLSRQQRRAAGDADRAAQAHEPARRSNSTSATRRTSPASRSPSPSTTST